MDQLFTRISTNRDQMAQLTRRLRYKDADGVIYIIPPTFVCDLASVPRILRGLSTPWHQSARAGFLHDCACRWDEVWLLGRKRADDLYREALRSEGVSRFRARAQWLGVRVGGWRAWRRWRSTDLDQRGVPPPPLVNVS